MKRKTARTVEMTGYGKRGKPKAGFPSFPTALGNRYAIPTFPQSRRRPRGKVEIQNQDSHFPTAQNRLRRKEKNCRLHKPLDTTFHLGRYQSRNPAQPKPLRHVVSQGDPDRFPIHFGQPTYRELP